MTMHIVPFLQLACSKSCTSTDPGASEPSALMSRSGIIGPLRGSTFRQKAYWYMYGDVGEKYEQPVRSGLLPFLSAAQAHATAFTSKQQACYLDERTSRLQARRF